MNETKHPEHVGADSRSEPANHGRDAAPKQRTPEEAAYFRGHIAAYRALAPVFVNSLPGIAAELLTQARALELALESPPVPVAPSDPDQR